MVKTNYSFKVGAGKSIKNAVVPVIGALIAVLGFLQANCNLSTEVMAGTGITVAFAIGMVENWLKNRK